jgi:hypothetical protein
MTLGPRSQGDGAATTLLTCKCGSAGAYIRTMKYCPQADTDTLEGSYSISSRPTRDLSTLEGEMCAFGSRPQCIHTLRSRGCRSFRW